MSDINPLTVDIPVSLPVEEVLTGDKDTMWGVWYGHAKHP